MTVENSNAKWESAAAELAKLMEEKITLPVYISYAICKNRLRIEQALSAYRMTRDDVIGTYSNGKGRLTEQDDPELFEKACREIADLAAIKVAVDITPVSLDELGACDKLPLNVMAALSFMITEWEE